MTEPTDIDIRDLLWRLRGYDMGICDEAAHAIQVLEARLAFSSVERSLGQRAARLVADMLQQAGRYLTHGYGEINEVLLEARQRGWLEPIE